MSNFAYYNQKLQENYDKELDWWTRRIELVKQGRWDQADYIDNVVLKRINDEFQLITKNMQEEINKRLEIDESEITDLDINEDENTSVVEESRFKPIKVDLLLSEKIPPTEWIVEKLIPKDGIIAFSGLPASYKTWIVNHVAVSVSLGTNVFNKFPTKKCNVLIVDEENNKRLIQHRLCRLGVKTDTPLYFLFQEGIKIDKKEDLEELLKICADYKIGLIIFDSLIRFHTKDENDAVAMARVSEALKQFTKQGITVGYTHHHRKQTIYSSKNPSQSLRGSSEILANVDCHLAIHREQDFILIEQTKLRQEEEIKPFKVVIKDEEERTVIEYSGEHDEAEQKKEVAKQLIANFLKDSEQISRKNLTEALQGEVGQRAIYDALKEMEANGSIHVVTGSHGKKLYSIGKPPTEQQNAF